jgi:hypothetical protein
MKRIWHVKTADSNVNLNFLIIGGGEGWKKADASCKFLLWKLACARGFNEKVE